MEFKIEVMDYINSLRMYERDLLINYIHSIEYYKETNKITLKEIKSLYQDMMDMRDYYGN